MAHISDIKLIRIDATLDLCQKKGKGMSLHSRMKTACIPVTNLPFHNIGDLGLETLCVKAIVQQLRIS